MKNAIVKNLSKGKGCIGLCFIFFVCLTRPVMAEQNDSMLVVVNADVQVQELTTRELADIYLGYKRHWDNGTRIRLSLLEDTIKQKDFLQLVTGRNPSQFWSHWRNIVFSGRGLMPEVFTNESSLVKYIAANKGTIGHITQSGLTRGLEVKTLRPETVKESVQ